jgi:hypothetical protein
MALNELLMQDFAGGLNVQVLSKDQCFSFLCKKK